MKKLHMIGNAHLDPVWLWRWQEGFQETKATFKSMLDRMDEYDDVVFTSSSAQCYEWVEKNDPEMFERIKQRVQEGRWVICNGWWVQPDCNLPSGESFARHALIAQNYFYEKFGVTSKTGYNVDSFGHNGMLPQILRQSGMDSYVFMRPGPQEKGLPGWNFIWESDDGSWVYACRIPMFYSSHAGDLSSLVHGIAKEFDPQVDELLAFYGVGNHGGGPTVRNIESIKTAAEELGDVEVLFSDPHAYFESIAKKKPNLPVVHGDLQHHASGCYSAHSEVKKYNRKAENALLRAEKIAVMSEMVTGTPYPDNFDHAWKRVLFNQFHDILAGSSIEEAYEDARNEYGEALAIAGRNENNALQAISFKINIEKDVNMLPLVVFNPHSWDVEEPVVFSLRPALGLFPGLSITSKDFVKVLDSDGNEIPVQKLLREARLDGANLKITFKAKVPALGYATYRIVGIRGGGETSVDREDLVLENDLCRVEFDRETGAIRSIWNKEYGYEFCNKSKGFGRAAVIKDDSDTWSHDVYRYDNLEGYFSPVSIKRIEEGPVRSSVLVVSRYGDSILKQTYTLYKGEHMVRVDAKLDWREKWRCLKLQFPLRLDISFSGNYEIPFGRIEKTCNGEEEPMQNWMDLTGVKGYFDFKKAGVAILNDSKYSGCLRHNMMEMTVLRSPIYAYDLHDKLSPEEEDQYQYMDQGIQTFKYIIMPHIGTIDEAEVVQRAAELNQPCTVLMESYHEGPYVQKGGFIHVSSKNVLMTALKKARDGDGYIARFYEISGSNTDVVIDFRLFGKKIETTFKAHEIKTFRITADLEQVPEEVNFLEWNKK